MRRAQRLGYLIEHVGAGEKALPLNAYVRQRAKQSALLLPTAPLKRAHRNDSGKLYVNATVAAEL